MGRNCYMEENFAYRGDQFFNIITFLNVDKTKKGFLEKNLSNYTYLPIP